jgi:hypothetical protein
MNEHQKLAIEALRDFEAYHLNAVQNVDLGNHAENMRGIYSFTKEGVIDWHLEKAKEIQAAIEWIKTIGGNDDTI